MKNASQQEESGKRIGHHLTVGDLAEALNVSLPTVRRYLQAGEFPNAMLLPGQRNKTWRVPTSDLDAFIRRNQPHRQLDAMQAAPPATLKLQGRA